IRPPPVPTLLPYTTLFRSVALPGQLAAAGFPAAEHWKIYLVTMLISFVSVVPFIIYAEVKRKMKRVFVGCVALLLIAEIVLWGADRKSTRLNSSHVKTSYA